MSLRFPKKIRLLSLSLSTLILIFVSFWTFSIFQIKHSLENRLLALQEQGYNIYHEDLKVRGVFPTITLEIKNIVLEDILISKNAGLSLKTEALLLSFSPFSPKKIKGSFQTLKGLFSQEGQEIIFGPTFLELSSDSFCVAGASDFLVFQNSKTILTHLEDFSLSITPQTMVSENDQGSYETPGFKIEGSLKKLSLNQEIKNISPDVENISFSAFLMEKIDFSEFPQKSLKTIFTAWRDQGGAFDIQKANMAWGAITLSFQGTLALDETLNPEGAFTSTLKGIPEFLKQLSQNQTYSRQDRLFLELSLGFLAGTSGEITLPLTLQNQALRLGTFININIPPLAW